jgi:hypothetical protein
MQSWKRQRAPFVDVWLPVSGVRDHVLDYAYEWQGSLKYTIDKPTECFDWLAVELDGKLVTASHDESALLVSDVKTGALICTLGTGGNPVSGMVVWNQTLACVSRDCEVRVWDIDQRECTLTLNHPTRVEFVAVFQNKLLTACIDSTLRLWDGGTCVAIFAHAGNILGLKVVSAHAIAVRTMRNASVYVFERGEFVLNYATAELDSVLSLHPVYSVYGLHTDGLLVVGGKLAIFSSYKLNVWTHGEDDLRLFRARDISVWPHGSFTSEASVLAACALYDGRIAASCMDQTIRLFDVSSGSCTQTIDCKHVVVGCAECDNGPDKHVEHLVQLPDGKLAAAFGVHVCVWDLASGELVFKKHYGCEITTLLVIDCKLIVGCPTPCDGCECEPGHGCKTCGQLHALE